MRLWQIGALGAAGTALLLVAAFPPFDLRPAAAIALVPLLYALSHEPRARHRALWGWVAGTLYWGVTCWWIQGVLNRSGGLNLPLSLLAISLFSAAKGLHLAIFAALVYGFFKRAWGLLAIPALWTGLERTHGIAGFTWLQLGNAGIDMGIPMRSAPYAGVYGVSFVLAALSAGVTWAVLRKPRVQLVWLAPLAILLVLPAIRPDGAPRSIAVAAQPAFSETGFGTRGEFESLIRKTAYATLSQAMSPDHNKPDLLLWPETPAPLYYYADSYFRETVAQVARLADAPFLFGTVASTSHGAPLNSAVMLNAEGRLDGRYDKVHLVPFGEFVPPLFGWINKISAEAGDYAPGDRIVTFPTPRGTVGAFICYESAFGEHVREFARAGAGVLVNLTNDGYFARSPARMQHLLLARMRAVENRRWLLRPSNDGVTAAISPAGLVHDMFPPFQPQIGLLHFEWIKETTFYTRHGDIFSWACFALALVLRVYAELPQWHG